MAQPPVDPGAPREGLPFWEQRYQGADYLFGTQPSAFVRAQAYHIPQGARVLAVADGEGRNGVWLAQNGRDVHAVDGSARALEKARALAAARGVTLHFEQADLLQWDWPVAAFDAVVAVFIQFAKPQERQRMFEGMTGALRPGGVLLLHGYTPRQLQYGTGGPPNVEQLYTKELLRAQFRALRIFRLEEYDQELEEGTAHKGPSALIDLVARRPG